MVLAPEFNKAARWALTGHLCAGIAGGLAGYYAISLKLLPLLFANRPSPIAPFLGVASGLVLAATCISIGLCLDMVVGRMRGQQETLLKNPRVAVSLLAVPWYLMFATALCALQVVALR
jgi:phage shock protein PspC (stress-responsive transcriptional regulator)